MIFPLKHKNLPQNKEIYQKYENIPKNLEIYPKVQKYTCKLKYKQKIENLQLGGTPLTTPNKIYN